MATLIFSAIGTMLGGPIVGAIGALAGRQVDALIFAPKPREGARLAELAVSSSSYGVPVAQLFGRTRTAGQVIWATDLTERRDRQGNGKGRPATVTYSYSASFAVALSSRPVETIGRIWADGKLLRGAGGDLKVGGTLRIHNGYGDQAADPLIAAAEGAANCPAWRGLAYVVFEDLQLADYGNRIPALSFEVIADAGPLSLQPMLDPVLRDCDAAVPLDGLEGFAVSGPPADTLALLDPLFPLDCDACDAALTIRPERNQGGLLDLPEPAIATASEDFGGKAGFTRSRALVQDPPLSVLRHYDPARDYQPGVQRAAGRPAPGQPRVLELPATIAAPAARALIDAAVRRKGWGRQTIQWRVTQLDPAIRPGALVSLPDQPGRWRVRGWEWRSEGIELSLARVALHGPGLASSTDPGRVGSDPDLPIGPTTLVALELPWDGNPATPVPLVLAAAGSSGPGWSGASLFIDQGDGGLEPVGATGRASATVGVAETSLSPASPLVIDRLGTVTVRLVDHSRTLAEATSAQAAAGANRALLGHELIQFQAAEPLGEGRWRLSGLWRGRGGTEHAVASHGESEPFVLLDGTAAVLDPGRLGAIELATIAAIGLADLTPAESPVWLAGIGSRPLSPVHGHVSQLANGDLRLTWTRRVRGGWRWADGVDLPLNEQREAYIVEFGPPGTPLARWETAQPLLGIDAGEWAALQLSAPGGTFAIRQVGDRGMSLALTLAVN